jgi:myb proto-oncogene protein
MRLSNRRGGGAAGAAVAGAGAVEDDNNPRNAKKPRPDASSMASLLDKYRREFSVVPFAINHNSNQQDYCSTTNEGEYYFACMI